MSRDGSFSSAQNAHYDSLETSEEREGPKFGRLIWNLDLFSDCPLVFCLTTMECLELFIKLS